MSFVKTPRESNSNHRSFNPQPSRYIDQAIPWGKVHPRAGHENPDEEKSHSSTLSWTSALDGGEGCSTPLPGRFTPRERTDTRWIGGWVDPRAGLDERAKIRPYSDSIPLPYSLYPVATPTTPSRHTSYPWSLFKWLINSVVCLTTFP
jgi:hypothetical protein